MALRHCWLRAAALASLFCLLGATVVTAQTAKTFAVLPFEIHGSDKFSSLSQGIQSMLTTRLTWPGKLAAVDKSKIASLGKVVPASKEDVSSLLGKLGADYLVWGSVTVLGDQASLDLQVQDTQGNVWPKSSQTKVDGLIPALEKVSKDINAEIFKKPEAQTAAQKPQAGPLNAEFVQNETGDQTNAVLNPDIRYEGSNIPGRWTSQSLPFASSGMAVGDLDGDGHAKIVILGKDKLHAYTYQADGLRPAGEYNYPTNRFMPLKINLLDMNRNGTKSIIISGFEDNGPRSMILTYKNGVFSTVMDRIDMYLNVVRTPPDYVDTLVGQSKGHGGMPFDKNLVHEVNMMGGTLEMAKRLKLPDHTNVFNFCFLPQGESDYKIVIVDSSDHLRIHDRNGTLQATTDERYAGTSVGIEYVETTPGMGMPGTTTRGLSDEQYIPLRLMLTNFEQGKKWDILVNRDVSVAAQFFQRYRYFPQGELQSLSWDGVGMSLVWKTRSIKGSVMDYGLADVNGDGKQDLWVCVNSHPGAAGVTSIRTNVLFYPLDLSSMPKTGEKKLKMMQQY